MTPTPTERWTRIREELIAGEYGYTDDPSHLADLDPGQIMEWPILLIEGSTRDSRIWASLHATPDDAMAHHADQEYAEDWEVNEIIDLRDGSRWSVTGTTYAWSQTDPGVVDDEPGPVERAWPDDHQWLAQAEGWWISNGPEGEAMIQALDHAREGGPDAIQFADDDSAVAHVRRLAEGGSALHRLALACVETGS